MFELFVSLRYLLAKRQEKFISLISLLAVGGVTLSVATLIVVISVMSGFEKDLKEKILGTYAHLTVSNEHLMGNHVQIADLIQKQPEVVAVTPYIYGQIMLRLKGKVYGAVVRGIQIEGETRTTNLKEYLVEGDLKNLGDGILIGEELANTFALKVGDTISLLSPAAGMESLGLTPPVLSFEIKGIFNSGMYEYDSRLVYVSLESAQLLFGLGDFVHGVNVKIKDPLHAYQTKQKLVSLISAPNEIQTWMELNRNLFGALKTEKNVMFILLVMAIAVAAMNIASTLIMMVMEKTKDIGILKSIGAHSGVVLKIFLLQGFVVGVLGTFIGAGLGLSIVLNIDSLQALISRFTGFEVFPSDIYYLDKIPADANIKDILIISASALGISILASVYPAFRAARLNAVEALRYE